MEYDHASEEDWSASDDRDLRTGSFYPFRMVMKIGKDTIEIRLMAIGESQIIYCCPHSDGSHICE